MRPSESTAAIAQLFVRNNSGVSRIQPRDYFASGSGRIWNFITLLVVPLPVSMWNGVLVDIVVQTPRPFHPAFGSSIRPSIHFV